MTTYIETAKIYYTPKTSNVVGFNSVTGRPIIEESTIEEFISVSLEQRSTEPQLYPLAGRDISGIFCRGRLLPIGTSLPDWFSPDGNYRIEWTNGRIGRFYAKQTIHSRFGLQAVFGALIQGVYTQVDRND